MIDRINTEFSDFMPDYKKWLRKDTWNLVEAVCLLRNIDPDKKDQFFMLNIEYMEQFQDDLDTAQNAAHKSLPAFTGTIDYINGDTETTVEHVVFIRWANFKGYEIPKPLLHLLDNVEENKIVKIISTDEEPRSQLQTGDTGRKINQRVELITKFAIKLFSNPMAIPAGGKSDLRKILCKKYVKLFTKATFDVAWKKAKKNKLIEVENVEQYKSVK